ncbi:hypothetical protein [Thiocystis violascens]|nr:hypothetical protein [Thiocystis violascens]
MLIVGVLSSWMGSAPAGEIPSARTASNIITLVTISGGQPTLIANPAAYASVATNSVAVSMSTTVRAIQDALGLPVLATNGISLYQAGSSVDLSAIVADQVVVGGAIAPDEPLVVFRGSSETLAAASFAELLFARAGTVSQGVLDGAILNGSNGGSSLNLSWYLDDWLILDVEPIGGLALVSQRVQFFQVSATGQEQSLGEVSLLAWLEDGEASLRVFDGLDSSAFQGWVGDSLVFAPGILLQTSIALPASEQSISLRIVDTRAEVSIAAAPRASLPVLSGVGSRPVPEGEDAPRVYWDPETGILRFDPLPINWSGGVLPDQADDALLSGGKIEIGDFRYFGESDGRRYFVGGTLTLTDSQGAPLLSASLPALVLEDSLFQFQGFNLFAPILNILDVNPDRSGWLDGLADLLTMDSTYLPELFLGVDDLALSKNLWNASFDAPVNGMLAFAGIAAPLDLENWHGAIPLPATIALIACGFALMLLRCPGFSITTVTHRSGKSSWKCEDRNTHAARPLPRLSSWPWR